MTILKSNNIFGKKEESDGYTLPVVVTKKHDEISLKKSIVISSVLHPGTVLLCWLITIILALCGISLKLFEKQPPKVRDIEFVLVDKEDTPINKNTPYRADINSRAGGKHNPKKPVSMPSPAPAKGKAKSKPSSASSDLQKMIQKQQKKVVQQATQQVAKPQPQKQTAAPQKSAPARKVVEQPKQISAPKTVAPRPASVPSAPRVTSVPKSNFQTPVPRVATPKVGPAQGGPVAGTSSGTRVGSSGSGTARTGAAPSFAPAKSAYGTGSGHASSGQGRFSGSSAGGGYGAGGHGSAGNPGPGNPNGRPGIDAVRDVDFGPYMRDLQRRIKMNWDPPKGNESKRVVLLFSISRDGRLLNVKVAKSSGVAAADRAAISAVQLTAPFKPLPAGFKGTKVDIQFTFDYNVFGASGFN